MGHELPDYAFEGIGGMGNDLFFDRQAMGALVFQQARHPQMDGVGDFFKKVVSTVSKPIVGITKAVGKGVINAAGRTVGLGPIFEPGQTATVVPGGQMMVAAPPPAPNYMPLIIGGVAAAGLIGIILLTRRK